MGLEEAREQLNASIDEAPEKGAADAAPESKVSEITDLDSLEKFKFDGKEWTAKDLKAAYMMQQDYTRKTQALSEERRRLEENSKFDLNLKYDLQRVLQDPSLAQQFRSLYPKEYHVFLDKLVGEQQKSEDKGSGQGQVPPELLGRLDKLESTLFEKDVQNESAQIDSIMQKMAAKYDLAGQVPDLILARAEILAQNGKLDEKAWESIYKSVQDEAEKLFKGHYDKQFKQQQNASRKAKDAGPGGGTPGQAPVAPKSLKDATRAAMEALAGREA